MLKGTTWLLAAAVLAWLAGSAPAAAQTAPEQEPALSTSMVLLAIVIGVSVGIFFAALMVLATRRGRRRQ